MDLTPIPHARARAHKKSNLIYHIHSSNKLSKAHTHLVTYYSPIPQGPRTCRNGDNNISFISIHRHCSALKNRAQVLNRLKRWKSFDEEDSSKACCFIRKSLVWPGPHQVPWTILWQVTILPDRRIPR